jgi:nitronate monooxygenase
MLDALAVPIVQAPMAGGPSSPPLAAAVSEAGGLGFVAAGYRTPEALRGDIDDVRARTGRPFGVNLFAAPAAPADGAAVDRYREEIVPVAEAAGVSLGEPRFDDDRLADKLELLTADPVAVVSFTFGCPDRATVTALQRAGSVVWVTVTSVAEACAAARGGADALVVQGIEAGGHRATFADGLGDADGDTASDVGLLALLQLVGEAVDRPLVATGGIATGRGIAAVLAAGARAAQLGSAFLLCPEATTSAPHRAALRDGRPTALTRAFTGRLARGLVNRFLIEHSASAPPAYPEVHHLTAPLRAHGRRAGDPEVLNLWAGQAHALARELPAAELVRRLAEEARAALDGAR